MANTTFHTAYIGLGSNLDNPRQQISSALRALESLPNTRHITCSQWYGSKAIGPGEQPDYINAAVRLETQLSPFDLLEQLQQVENTHGRQRDIRWGARTLDLDLLLHGDNIIDSMSLQLPHAEILNRNFVLYPLYDLTPELVFPNGERLQEVIQAFTMDGLYLVNADETIKD